MADGIRGIYEQLGHGRPSGFAADAAAVLRQLEDRVRAVQGAAPGNSRAFLDLAGRMAKRLTGPGGAGGALPEGDATPAGGAGGPSIIVP
jgi:hypothetical protein